MKTWFITGVSRGLDRALAEAVVAQGDTVLGTVREAMPAIAAGSGVLHAVPLEITEPAAVKAAIDDAFTKHGPIDVLVNNAGYGLLGAIEDASEDETARLFDVNVFAPLRLIQVALPHLREQDQPPLHLLLGSDALRRTRHKLAAVTRELDIWEPVTLGTDFPEGA